MDAFLRHKTLAVFEAISRTEVICCCVVVLSLKVTHFKISDGVFGVCFVDLPFYWAKRFF